MAPRFFESGGFFFGVSGVVSGFGFRVSEQRVILSGAIIRASGLLRSEESRDT